MSKKCILLFPFFLCVGFLFSQTDTSKSRGTIKVAKATGEIYIKAVANFNKYDVSKFKLDFAPKDKSQPFPFVDGYAYPFDYTNYFTNCFRSVGIDMKGKTVDTLIVEAIILSNGKSFFRELAVDDDRGVVKLGASDMYDLHLNGLHFLRNIRKWFPGYFVIPKKTKFKGQVVIKPDKKNVDVSGTITILFSTTPFED